MDAVFALQRAGGDAVFSHQFPVAATVAQGSGAGLGAWPYQRPVTTPRQSLRELQEAEAAEIAAAAVARARAAEPADGVTPPVSPVPESLARLAQPLDSTSLLVQIQTVTAQPVMGLPSAPMGINPAALDEEAILSASMLLMRRRRK